MARLMQRRVPGDAAQWYADALHLLPHATPTERVVLLTRRAFALENGGRPDAAWATFQDVLGLVAAGSSATSPGCSGSSVPAPGPPSAVSSSRCGEESGRVGVPGVPHRGYP